MSRRREAADPPDLPGRLPPGAIYLGNRRCHFSVWAPVHSRVELRLLEPVDRAVPLVPGPGGMHQATVEDVAPGSLYFLRPEGGPERPDPASRRQPRGVHGPSAVVDPAFDWTDAAFDPPRLSDLVLYEIHVGTFTSEGTFDAARRHLRELKDLGVNALELMPVASFPGGRNWGYDGVYPWAVQESYGGPDGLRRLVDACHREGLGVFLDVVYNHLGPEGNYLGEYGPYFTDRYRTPWGRAVNFDGPGSDEVRRYFVESALYFVTDFHLDGLRLDAIHAIFDQSAHPFLQELGESIADRAARLGRPIRIIAESNLNDARFIRPVSQGGIGLDAQWADDFHHALHALLTGERNGYYRDFGELDQLARAFRDGFVYTGQYSEYRRRRHGHRPDGCPGERFVVAIQNHDQIGNRARGDRLSALLRPPELGLAACLMLLAPYVPLLFMGEEYGEQAPFQYFTSHSDPALIEAVRRGRKEEFSGFGWEGEEPPDPQDEATFERSKLRRELADRDPHRGLRDLYRELLRLRRESPALRECDRAATRVEVHEKERALLVGRGAPGDEVVGLFALGTEGVSFPSPLRPGRWRVLLDSSEARWGGDRPPGPPFLEAAEGSPLTLRPRTAVLLAPEKARS